MKLTTPPAPLVKAKAKAPGRKRSPERIACDEKGIPYSTVKARMRRYDMTFEEALAMPLETKSTAGRKGRKNTAWNAALPKGEQIGRAKQEKGTPYPLNFGDY